MFSGQRSPQALILREERLWRVAQRLKLERQVRVSDLSRQFGLTAASVRNDLAELERRGVCRRVYGGAVLAESEPHRDAVTVEASAFEVRLKRQRAEKEAIALAVLDLIGDGETLMIDGGTTTAEVCGLLGARRNLTVVSSALNPALPALVTDCGVEVFLTGGYLLPQSQALVGDAAEASLRGIHAGKAILGMDGVSLEHGLTTQKFLEARMKRLMIESCDSVIIVADHTKLGRIGMIHVAPLTAADTLVTDELAPSELLEQLEMRGIRVVIARVGAAEPDQ